MQPQIGRSAQLSKFVENLVPEDTVLFLGAGASIPSGAPSGKELSRSLCQSLASGEEISDELAETCSILENRRGRDALVNDVRTLITPLQPTGGLVSLPQFAWHSIYTTNFDRLIELSYMRRKKQIIPVRSNFDYAKVEAAEGTPLFKIHGCVTQDLVDGHRARMVLTERDYEEYSQFREVLFERLSLDLLTKHILVVGHSLKDIHLRNDMQQAAKLHHSRGAPGKLQALIYEEDQDRAALWEQRGFSVTFGGIDEFIHEISSLSKVESPIVFTSASSATLPTHVASTAVDISHAKGLYADVVGLYNGSPASYADVASNLTIKRSVETPLLNEIKEQNHQFLIITGVAGVGKTTLARRLMNNLVNENFIGWEHKSDFPLKAKDWMSVEASLRNSGARGVLFIDDCTQHMRQVNKLAQELYEITDPALSLILTASNSQWKPRTKSRALFAGGTVRTLSRLTEQDIEQLVNLVDGQPAIRNLVEQSFARLSRSERIRRLRTRCSADMYVCLKNIFATDALDTILLREYAELEENLQDIYRHVATLEATGARVHRQLIIRLLNINSNTIVGMLALTEGLISEYDIEASNGLYGWATRHQVVAQTISRYKFADQEELYNFFAIVIDKLNPTVWLEMRMLRDLCGELGIQRLTADARRISLYQSLIDVVPGERVPRHRLISTLIHSGQIDSAAQEVRDARESVGDDPVISRYTVLIALNRAESTSGILEEDRRAMLLEAQRLALKGIESYPHNRYTYQIYGDVGIAMVRRFGDVSVLDDAISQMTFATDLILDPELNNALRSLENERDAYTRNQNT